MSTISDVVLNNIMFLIPKLMHTRPIECFNIANQTIVYETTDLIDPAITKDNKDFTIEIINSDSINAGLLYQSQGYKVAVLVMANKDVPGGDWIGTNRSQEELIYKRSLLPVSTMNLGSLKVQPLKSLYPIGKTGAIYSPDVFIILDDKLNVLPIFPTLNFISASAIDMRPVIDLVNEKRNSINLKITKQQFENECQILFQDIKISMCDKIRSVLRVALLNYNDCVILGGWGSGVFGHNPNNMAEYFKEVLNEAEFSQKFKKIVFAIYDGPRISVNFQAYQSIFTTLKIPLPTSSAKKSPIFLSEGVFDVETFNSISKK